MGEAAQAPGRPPSARSPRLLRAVALIAAGTLLTGLLQVVQTLQAPGAQAAVGSGSRTAAVALNKVDPRVPAKDGSVTVSGTVTNNGKTTITGARMGVRVAPDGPLTSLSAMKSAQDRTGYTSYLDGSEIDGHTVDLPKIPAGQSQPFSLKVPVKSLGFDASGVYQLGVALDGETSAEPGEHVLGIKRTFLPWYDTNTTTAKATQITYLWPLTDRPHVAARGDTDSQQSPIFLDDDLAKELSPGGRLQVMVDLAKSLPVTWIIDPDLLASIDFMTKPYRVAGPGGDVTHTTEGTGGAVAKAWLNSLKSAVAGDQVIALPFADTDLASVAHNGLRVPGTLNHLKTASELGVSTLDTVLGVQATSDVAWPVDGAVDPAIVSVARTGGAKRIVARSDSVGESDALSYTPNAARPIGHGVTAVVADASLSTAFEGDMLRAEPADLAVQDFVAQTLMITMQAPERQRTILVAPQRMPTVSQAQAMAEAIGTVGTSPWAATVGFDTAAKAKADPDANRKVPSAKKYPKALRRHELSVGAFQQLSETQTHLNDFVTILTRKDKVTVPFGNSVLRAMSAGWRGDPADATEFRSSIGGYLQDLINAVRILPKTTLTLSGRSGTIPVTVKNELNQPITNLVLRLTSNTDIRLEIKDPQQPIAIDGGHTRTLKFQTSASANGKVRVTAALFTAQGVLYRNSNAVEFDVKITKVTDLVMLIIAAGLLLLVLAGVRIYRQRKRQAAADSGGDGGDGEDGDNGGGQEDGDPGQPGDPGTDTEDTGRESVELSPTGEKVEG
ncbi:MULTISPECIES: DUF6049 family protein [unclassified Streptomyces]|uniref:DUF6049 family protein n=1 Tax=unclassified Streptomyces TaxID=2593676 RepID=UPI0036F09B29